MRFSVVVPFHNSSATLDACLRAIASAHPPAAEVILVDDASTDGSPRIAAGFNFTLMRNSSRLGRGAAKNAGAARAGGDIIVFIDSDVVIEPGTFAKIEARFTDDPPLAGLSALPSPRNPFENMASQFKALYMHYVLSGHSGRVRYAHGCVQAYRREVFKDLKLSFDEHAHCDDVELGLGLSLLDKKLVMDSELSCEHLRYYSLLQLLKNDFRVPREFAKLAFRYRALAPALQSGSFAHASRRQVLAVFFAPLAPAFLLAALLQGSQFLGLCAMPLVGANLWLNSGFIRFLRSRKDSYWCLKAVSLNLIDQCCMAAGLGFGLLEALVRRGYSGARFKRPSGSSTSPRSSDPSSR